MGTIFLFVGGGMELLYPQAIRMIIDEALEKGRPEDIDRAALFMVAIFAVQAVASASRYFLFTTAGERIVMSLRERLYRHMVEQEIGFFDQRRTGELMNRLASDTTVIQSAVSVNISMALRNLFGTIGGAAMLFYISPKLGALMLVVVPPVALGAVAYGRKIRRLSRRVQDALAEAGQIAEETISGIRTVRAHAQERKETARYASTLLRAFGVVKRRIINVAMFSGIATFAGYAAVALVLWYGGRLVVGGQMSVGDLTSFVLYTMMVAFSLGALGGLWTDFMRATGAADRVFELLDREPEVPNQGGDKLASIEGRIELKRLNFSYPSRPDIPVLKDFELTIEPGEVVALVGPSGSGKSTVASLIARFYDPTGGQLLLDGRSLTELDATWLRGNIGVVSQEPTLMSTSIEENIRYGVQEASAAQIEAAARAANAHEFIEAFPQGYQTEVGERGVQLSGGQKQRVAIARALLKDPRILILDEATSALDAQSEHQVKEALDRLQEGRTTLVIAHRLSTVMGADRVAVLEHGRLVQVGAHKLLMEESEGLYRKLVQHQFVQA